MGRLPVTLKKQIEYLSKPSFYDRVYRIHWNLHTHLKFYSVRTLDHPNYVLIIFFLVFFPVLPWRCIPLCELSIHWYATLQTWRADSIVKNSTKPRCLVFHLADFLANFLVQLCVSPIVLL